MTVAPTKAKVYIIPELEVLCLEKYGDGGAVAVCKSVRDMPDDQRKTRRPVTPAMLVVIPDRHHHPEACNAIKRCSATLREVGRQRSSRVQGPNSHATELKDRYKGLVNGSGATCGVASVTASSWA